MGKEVWAAPGPEQQARGQLSESGRHLITQLGTERRKHTESGSRAQNLCEAEGRESCCLLCAVSLLWRKGKRQLSVGVFSVSSLLNLSVRSSTFGGILQELSSAVPLSNEPWHCLTAKQAHSHS